MAAVVRVEVVSDFMQFCDKAVMSKRIIKAASDEDNIVLTVLVRLSVSPVRSYLVYKYETTGSLVVVLDALNIQIPGSVLTVGEWTEEEIQAADALLEG